MGVASAGGQLYGEQRPMDPLWVGRRDADRRHRGSMAGRHKGKVSWNASRSGADSAKGRRKMKLALFILWVSVAFAGCARKQEPPTVSLSTVDRTLATLIESSRAAVLSNPSSAEAWGKLGHAFQAAEFTTEARACYHRASELDPNSARWLHLAGLLELPDEPEVALLHLRRAADVSSGKSDASRFALARALVERGRFDEAGPELESILAANSNHAGARIELGRIKFSRNELEGAR